MTPSEDNDKQKRFKVGRACYTCRQKKIKCDGLQPCMQCKVRRRPCSFAKDGKTDAVDWLENGDSDYDTKDEIPPPQRPRQESVQGLPRTYKRSFSDIDTTPRLDALEKIQQSPNLFIRKHLLLAYFKFRHEVFSILPRKWLLRDDIDGDPFVTPLLLNSMYAHAAEHIGREITGSDEPMSGSTYFTQATNLISEYLESSLSTIVALCLISIYNEDSKASLSKSWLYSGIAFRMATDIGFKTPHDKDLEQHGLELRKRVLWGCYVLDKIQSLISGKQWMISGHSVELDYPAPLPDENTLDHAVLDGFVALIRLMQICERVLHFEFFIAPHSKEHEQASLDLSHELLNWLRMLPAHLQWTPLPQAPADIPLQAPSSAMIANLHMCYNIVEMRLLHPYATTLDNRAIRSRYHAVANTIVQLIDFVYEDPTIVITPYLIVYAAECCAQFYIFDLKHSERGSREQTKENLSRTLRALRHLHETCGITEAGRAVYKLEASLKQEVSRYRNVASLAEQLPMTVPHPGGEHIPTAMSGVFAKDMVDQSERSPPVQSRYHNNLPHDQRHEVVMHGLRATSDSVFNTPQPQSFEHRGIDPFAFDQLQVDAGQSPWDVQAIPAADAPENGPVKLHNYDYHLNGQNLPRRIRLFTPYPTYNIPQPSSRPTMADSNLVSDNIHISPASVPTHATAQPSNFSLSMTPDSLDQQPTADQLLTMETAMSQQGAWDPQNKWYQQLSMDQANPASREQLDRQSYSEPTTPALDHQKPYRGIGLGVYASAHRHHTDVIRQHVPEEANHPPSSAPESITLGPPEAFDQPHPGDERHKSQEVMAHHIRFSQQAS
ncbi:hypothetical protein NQZ79_g8688 [Umbelopsis isabellina]|nr:hypothetical protein NQZ79_g8688 [Umbelopsis isabellina]